MNDSKDSNATENTQIALKPGAESTDVALNVTSSINTLNLLDSSDVAKAEIILKKLITSEKSGIKSVQDGLSVLMRAQDLKLPFSTCIEHIHVINGKTGVDIHIIKSLLSRAGVVWKCTKDYAPQYQYTDGNTVYLETQLPDYCVKCRTAKEAEDKTNDEVVGVYPVKWYQDIKGNIYNEFQVSDKCVKAINKAQALKIANEGKFPIIRVNAQPVDYVTEYEFMRIRVVHGTKITTTAKGHFSYTEAVQAGCLDKDTYKKYPRIMVAHRAFAFGAREIADDLIMGLLESTELGIVDDTTLNDPQYTEYTEE